MGGVGGAGEEEEEEEEGEEEVEMERVLCDVEETVFVAVGNKVERSRTTLFWAVQNFAGKRICLLHVHQLDALGANLATDKVRPHQIDAAQEVERKKMHDVLSQYQLMLAREGVQAEKLWIEMGNIEKGIVEVIERFNIRWLVMGAAADKYYSKKLAELKSKKAIFVCQYAQLSCHIWFACKGCLIYTREGINDRSEAESSPPLLLLDYGLGTEEPEYLGTGSVTPSHSCPEKDADNLEEKLGRFNDQSVMHSTRLNSIELWNPKLIPLLLDEEEKVQGKTTSKTCYNLERAIMDVKDLKQKSFEETLKRWKEEDSTIEAKCKAKALESLCVKEMRLKKEVAEVLAIEKQEVERTKNQRDEFMKELQLVQEQKSVLESQNTESGCVVKELEEKIISAVELLISFRKQRDVAQLEYENAITKVENAKRLAKMQVDSFCRSKILEFSFMEIDEATHNFDPSWKLGEGRYGSVYKGLLRHVHVTVKMLPSYGSLTQLDFQKRVEILSRVRHPNLVMLIGICLESRSLVYEYVKNGSLEDRLAHENKIPSLPWYTRITIAYEMCSALIFLHSNKPCIIHGNLRPSKVLLDANYVSKLSDFGIFHLIPQGENIASTSPVFDFSSFTSVYVDPEYIETGMLTPESDVYSFGIILLQLLTGRPAFGIVKDVKCAIENHIFNTVLDPTAGDWPLRQAKLLAALAVRCCERSRLNRPDLVSEIWCVLEPLRASANKSASCFGSKDQRRVPSHFVCPIFQEVMKDPHIAADGFTYDADAIRGWLKSGHNTSPMTNLKLDHCDLLPNHALHQAILEWRQQQ